MRAYTPFNVCFAFQTEAPELRGVASVSVLYLLDVLLLCSMQEPSRSRYTPVPAVGDTEWVLYCTNDCREMIGGSNLSERA